MVDDRDPVTQFFGFLEIMSGQNNSDAPIVQFADIGPELLAQFDINPGGRLIQHEDRGGVHQRLGDEQTTLHAARQCAGIGMGFVLKMDSL